MNIRHDLDPSKVAQQIAQRVTAWEGTRKQLKAQNANTRAMYAAALLDGTAHRWAAAPKKDDSSTDKMVDDCVLREKTIYAKVRVIELPQPGKRFILVYGDAEDATVTSGTGPFDTLDEAASWFFNSGR